MARRGLLLQRRVPGPPATPLVRRHHGRPLHGRRVLRRPAAPARRDLARLGVPAEHPNLLPTSPSPVVGPRPMPRRPRPGLPAHRADRRAAPASRHRRGRRPVPDRPVRVSPCRRARVSPGRPPQRRPVRRRRHHVPARPEPTRRRPPGRRSRRPVRPDRPDHAVTRLQRPVWAPPSRRPDRASPAASVPGVPGRSAGPRPRPARRPPTAPRRPRAHPGAVSSACSAGHSVWVRRHRQNARPARRNGPPPRPPERCRSWSRRSADDAAAGRDRRWSPSPSLIRRRRNRRGPPTPSSHRRLAATSTIASPSSTTSAARGSAWVSGGPPSWHSPC